MHHVFFLGQVKNAMWFFLSQRQTKIKKHFFFSVKGKIHFGFFSQSRAKCIMFFSSVKGKMRYDFFSQSRGKCHMFYLGREENTSSFFLGQENNAIVK